MPSTLPSSLVVDKRESPAPFGAGLWRESRSVCPYHRSSTKDEYAQENFLPATQNKMVSFDGFCPLHHDRQNCRTARAADCAWNDNPGSTIVWRRQSNHVSRIVPTGP